MAALAGVAQGDSNQAIEGSAGIQIHHGHQAPLFKGVNEALQQASGAASANSWLRLPDDPIPAGRCPPGLETLLTMHAA